MAEPLGDHRMSLSMDQERLVRMRAWESGAPMGPYTLDISPTMACNLNCLFCRRQDELREYYKGHRDLSDERWEEIVREAAAMGTRKIMVKGGGEPLLRRRLLLKLCGLIAPHGLTFSLLTNGTMIDETLAETFVRSGWDEVILSLDGPDAATHDFIREKPGVFEKAMRSLDRINHFKAKYRRELPRLQFHTVLTRLTVERLEEFLPLAKAHGVGHVGVFALHGIVPEELRLREEDKRRLAERLPSVRRAFEASGLNYDLNIQAQTPAQERGDGYRPAADVAPGQERGNGHRPEAAVAPAQEMKTSAGGIPCYFPWVHASITPYGAIAPCCYGEGHHPRADLHKVSFREAWLGHELSDYRGNMRARTMMPFCRGCPLWYQDDNARLNDLLAAGKGRAA